MTFVQKSAINSIIETCIECVSQPDKIKAGLFACAREQLVIDLTRSSLKKSQVSPTSELQCMCSHFKVDQACARRGRVYLRLRGPTESSPRYLGTNCAAFDREPMVNLHVQSLFFINTLFH